MYTYICIYIYMHICIYIYICIYVYMYVYIYTVYSHTGLYMYAHFLPDTFVDTHNSFADM